MFKYPFPSRVKDLISYGFSVKDRIFIRVNFSPVYTGEISAGHNCMYLRAYFKLFLRAKSTDYGSLVLRNSLSLPSVCLSGLQRVLCDFSATLLSHQNGYVYAQPQNAGM